MKRFFSFVFIMIVVAGVHRVHSQNFSMPQDTLAWEVNQLIDTSTDSVMTYSCTFVTYGKEKIEWLQKSGEYATVFNINSKQGKWNDPLSTGTVTYNVSTLNKSGSIIFSRDALGVQIELKFLENNINTMPLKFKVSTITEEHP